VTHGLKRIIIHWTVGGYTATDLDRSHYHFIVQGDGSVVHGKMKPEDNISTNDGIYGAHTLSLNTGSIGVAIAAMGGAQERPFKSGFAPMKTAQINAMCKLVQELCERYGIPVTRETVLTHAEVQPTLGVKQRGKWDIAWLPGMQAPGNPVTVGDELRMRIKAA